MTVKKDKILVRAGQRAKLNEVEMQGLDSLNIDKVWVSPKAGRVHFYILNLDGLDKEAWSRLVDALASLLGARSVFFWPRLAKGGWTESFKETLVHSLRLYLGQKSFLLQGAIKDMTLRQGSLSISLHSRPALAVLDKKKVKDDLLARLSPCLIGEGACPDNSTPLSPLKEIDWLLDTDLGLADQLRSLEGAKIHALREKQSQLAREGRDDRTGTGQTKTDVLLGRLIKAKAQPISSIVEEERSVVVQGKILNLDKKILRSGRSLFVFDLVDLESGITVKYFQEEDQGTLRLEDKIMVKVRGSVRQDRYTQELTLMVKDINRYYPACRTDDSQEKRIELHLHTRMSALDGLTDLESVLLRAEAWQHPALAITDHGGVQAFPNAHALKKKHGLGLKIIYGMEAYFVDDEENKDPKARPYHMIILVQNQKGFENLYRLVTRSNLDHFYRKPRVFKSDLDRHREGLIIGSACEAGQLFQAIFQEKEEETIKKIASYYDFLEVQPVDNNAFMVRQRLVEDKAAIEDINKKIIDLGKDLDKPVVATGDVHFLEPEDELYRRIIQCGQGYSDTQQPPLYYRTTQEMLSAFSYLDEAVQRKLVIDNPALISSWVEDDLNPVQTVLHPPKMEGADQEIRELCQARAETMYGRPLPQTVSERMERELKSIIDNGFSVLYLIAMKLVKKSNEDGYLVGSRGSVGSSFVATLLGITEVNPLVPHYRCPSCAYSEFLEDGSIGSGADLADKDCPQCAKALLKDGHEIPFETFLGFNGDKIPDIDLNFSGDYQPIIHKYTEVLFGKKNVFKAGTIATIADKTAFGFAKKFIEDQGRPTTRNAELCALASGCTGVKRTTGQHPGGIMVLPQGESIHRFTPLQRPAEDTDSDIVTSHFDYHSIDASLVKLDLLGHDDPTAIKMLEDITQTDARTIALDDRETLSLFSSADILSLNPKILSMQVGSLGIPEFGTRFVRKMLEDTRPKAFSELVRISGFSHGTDVWLNNAQELISSGQALLSEAISTRDDIMSYLLHRKLDPLTAFSIMEDVRKGRGLKPDYEKTMRDHQVPDWYILSCKKIKYMFPKAHAVAYVTMAFRIAWYKINYPQAFYAVYFSVRADEFDLDIIRQGPGAVKSALAHYDQQARLTAREKNVVTILEIALEMYARGIKLLDLDLYRSDKRDFLLAEDGLLPPLNAIAGLGEKAASCLVEQRKLAPFMSIEDLRVRSRLSSTVIEKMRELGMLEGLPESEQLCLFGLN